jgi:hypothetical protein
VALSPEASEEDDILILPPDHRTVNLRSGRLQNNFSSHGQVSLFQLDISPENHYQVELQPIIIIDRSAAFHSIFLLEQMPLNFNVNFRLNLLKMFHQEL